MCRSFLLLLRVVIAAIDSSAVQAFTPNGVLWAFINLGNLILSNEDSATTTPGGVSIDVVMFGATGEWVEAMP